MAKVAQGCVGLITQIITSITGLFVMNLGYLLFGSYIFYVLESPHESQLVSDLADRRQELIGGLTKLGQGETSTTSGTSTSKDIISDLRKNASIMLAIYEAKLADFYRKRAVLNINDETGSNATGQTKLWTPLGAIIYSYSVITTIGWGNIVPGTDNGKIVTIIYGIFGMPLLFALSEETGNMVAAFNLRLWKLIQGIFKVTSRLIGFKKIDKESEDDEDDDESDESDDDNDNRMRDRSGSNTSPLFDWNFPPEYGHVSETEILERVKIQQKLTQRIVDLSKDVKRKTKYLKSTESTVNFLLDQAINPARDLESVLTSMLAHKRIVNQEDVLQLVLAFDSMDFFELKLCMELVGVPSEMFRELLCKGKSGGIIDSTDDTPAKLIDPQLDSSKISILTVGPVNSDAKKCDSRVKLSLSGNGADSGEILDVENINTHQMFEITDVADAVQTANTKSEIVRPHVMAGDPEIKSLPSSDCVRLEDKWESKTTDFEVIMRGLKTKDDLCDDKREKHLPNNERVKSENTLRNQSVVCNEDLTLQNRVIKSELKDDVICTGDSISMRGGVKENSDTEQEMRELKIQKLAQIFSKVFEIANQSLVPSVPGVDVTKKHRLVPGVHSVDVTKKQGFVPGVHGVDVTKKQRFVPSIHGVDVTKKQMLVPCVHGVDVTKKHGLVPSDHGVDVTKKHGLVHGVQDVDVTRPHNQMTTVRRHGEERKQKRKTKRERNFVSGKVEPRCHASSVESLAHSKVEPLSISTCVVGYTKVEPARRSTGVGDNTKVEPDIRSTGVGDYTKVQPARRSTGVGDYTKVAPASKSTAVVGITKVEPARRSTGVFDYTKVGPALRSTGVGDYTKVEPCRRNIDEGGSSISNYYSGEASFLDIACSRHSLADSLKVQTGSRMDDGKAEQEANNPRGYRNGRRKKRKGLDQNGERSRENEKKNCNNFQIYNNEQKLYRSTIRQTISGKLSLNEDTLDDAAGLGSVDAITSNATEMNHHSSSYCTGGRKRIVADFKGRGRPDRRTRSDAKSNNHIDMFGVTQEGDRENVEVNARNPSDRGRETTKEDASHNGAAGDSNLSVKPPSKLEVRNLSQDCPMPSICIELARTGGDLEFNELTGEPACTNVKPFNIINGAKRARKSRRVNSGKEPLQLKHSRHTSTNRVKNFDFSSLHSKMSPYASITRSFETTGNRAKHLVGHKPRIHRVKQKAPTTGQSEGDVNQSADHNVNFKELFGVSDEPDDDESSYSMTDSDEYSDRGDSEDEDKAGQKGGEDTLPLYVLYLFVMIYMLLGALVYYHFTREAENKFLNWIYFIYVTLSTTGFGDLLPEEHMLLFTAVYGLLGMAIFNVLLNATLDTFTSAIDYINAFNVGTEEEDDASDNS